MSGEGTGGGGESDGDVGEESKPGGGSGGTARLSSKALLCCHIFAHLLQGALRLTGDPNCFPSHTFGFFLGSASGKCREETR